MRYASIFITILIVWIAIVSISAIAGDTEITFDLFRLTTAFTLLLFLFGFWKRK